MEWTNDLGRTIRVVGGDITRIPVDAMANAANSFLAGGGGVDGAIHSAGGPAIMRELDQIRAAHGGCPTGSAVATTAGDLPAKFVFHAVGPIYRDGEHGEPERLASCYRACLQLADERGVRTLSFPAISTGVYGYPLEAAARIAIGEVRSHLERPESSVQEVVFAVFGKTAFGAYRRILEHA